MFKCQHAFLLLTAVIAANVWKAPVKQKKKKKVDEILMEYMCCLLIFLCLSEIGSQDVV